MTAFKRNPLQIGRSSYRIEPRQGAWWVVETWDKMGRDRTRDDCEDWLGPFATEGEATAKRDELRAAAGG